VEKRGTFAHLIQNAPLKNLMIWRYFWKCTRPPIPFNHWPDFCNFSKKCTLHFCNSDTVKSGSFSRPL